MIESSVAIIMLILPGIVGGLIRGAVGISKNVWGNKKQFEISKVILTLLIASVVGGLASVLVGGDWRLSLLMGYAGSDLLEGLYKSNLISHLRKF